MGVWQPKGFNMAARVTPAALCCECQDIDRMKPELRERVFLVFHYFAVGLRRPSSLGGCGPRSTPRRLATLKICGSDASSLLAICSALCFLRASSISSRSFSSASRRSSDFSLRLQSELD
jgi:hypothetical protein